MWNQGNWQVFSAGSPPPRSSREAELVWPSRKLDPYLQNVHVLVQIATEDEGNEPKVADEGYYIKNYGTYHDALPSSLILK